MDQSQAPTTEADNLSGRRPSASLPAGDGESEYQSQQAPVARGYGTIQAPDPPNYTWGQDLRRNQPLLNSLNAARMIFISGGMSLAVSVGLEPAIGYGTHAQCCWFIAVIVGACISAFLAQKMSNQAFNLFASILVIVNGTLYTIFPQSKTWIVLARYCDGIAFGLTIIPTILTGSEQAVKRFRGLVLSVEHMGLSIGAVILTLFTSTWTTLNINTNRTHGIFSIVVGVLALIFTFVYTIESPIFHLRKNHETEAINALRQLQKPRTVTNETHATLNENKSLLEEDLIRGRDENISNSWIPLIKICLFRALVSSAFALPLAWGFLVANTLSVEGIPDPSLYTLCRFIGVLLSACILDRVSRRAQCAFSLLIGSLFLLGVGSLFSDLLQNSKLGLNTILVLLLFHQVQSGFVAPASTCYSGEAFSVSVKPYFILIAIIFENIIQIVICLASTIGSTSNYAYTLAALQFIFALVFYFTFPETKETTLREALEMFKKRVYINLGNV